LLQVVECGAEAGWQAVDARAFPYPGRQVIGGCGDWVGKGQADRDAMLGQGDDRGRNQVGAGDCARTSVMGVQGAGAEVPGEHAACHVGNRVVGRIRKDG
jgi:hypothetical protein